ncbi:MAG: hypothetical protein ABSF90_22225 [Syntrophobacteraceae bacterium]
MGTASGHGQFRDSVEILPLPPPKVAANLAGGPTAPPPKAVAKSAWRSHRPETETK